MLKLVICGNYGASNIGDEAILDGILALIRRVEPSADITVLSANPAETTAIHGVKSAYLLPAGIRSFVRGIFDGRMMKTFKILKECDGFILGGGGLLSDERLMAMIIWPLQAAFASILRKPIFCLGQSVGPFKTFFGKRMAKSVYKKAALSTVRDTISQQVLHNLGLAMPTVLADPAFAIHLAETPTEKRENLVFFSLRKWKTADPQSSYKLFAHFIEWIWHDYGLKCVLVPFSSYPEVDTEILNNIFAHVKERRAAEVFEYSGDYGKIVELMGRAKAVVGMRLHSLIFATLTKTPFLGISYSDKVKGLASDLEMSDYVLNWSGLRLEDLKSGFKSLMHNYDKVALNLGEKNLLMRAKAHEHEVLLRTFFDTLKRGRG